MTPYDGVLFNQLVPVGHDYFQYYTLGPTKNMQGQEGQLQQITSRAQKQTPVVDGFKVGVNPQDPSRNYIFFNMFQGEVLLWKFPIYLSEMITNPIFQNLSFPVPWNHNLIISYQCNSKLPTVNETLIWRLRYIDLKI